MTGRHSAAQESIVAYASQIKDSLEGLVAAFASMISAIEHEHDCIKSGNIKTVEAACAEKTVIGEKIEALHASLRTSSAQIARVYAMELGLKASFANIQDCISAIDDLREHFGREGLAADILERLNSQLRRLTVEFQTAAKKAQPLIEMNKYLVQTLLRNYQESYRFWVDIAAETQATYSAKGVQKATNVGSTLVVRA